MSHSPGDSDDVGRQLAELKAKCDSQSQQLDRLRDKVDLYAETVTVQHVLENGFDGVIAELEPLRQLAPPERTQMDRNDGYKRLQSLRDAIARPRWVGAGSLSIREEHVPFIGEVAAAQNPEGAQDRRTDS